MDLMTLAAKITLDDSSFKSGIANAESMGERLSGKMSAMTVAVGNLVADVVRKAVSGIQSVIGGAVEGFADYQQLIGGVETLFKGSADKVAAYAKESFRTTGLSANDYMETVTSFSASLLQGLKGDTDTAADLANTAIQDMADNANKMGTDISAIQTAYQGFAKQNYTMLDNLKLGYGGTKEEMVRLINDSGILDKKIKDLDNVSFDQIIEAIHQIQEEMGIAGTTAQEAAETISGSRASLSAAWSDLLSAIGGEGDRGRLDETVENFKTSFQTYMDNYLPQLETTVANIGTLVEAVGEAVSNLPRNAISKLIEGGLVSGTGIMNGTSDIVNWLIDSIVQMLNDLKIDESKVIQFGKALGTFVGSAVGKIVTNLPAIVDGLFNVGITLAGSIIGGIFNGLFGNGTNDELEAIKTQLTETITDAEVQSAKAQSILSYMESLHEKFGAAATQTDEWKRAEQELETVLGGSKDVFASYGDDVGGAIEKLREMAQELRKLAIQQAFQDKLTAEYKLLGEAQEKKFTAEENIAFARGELSLFDSQRSETAKAIARVLLQNEDYMKDNPFRAEAYETAKLTLSQEGYAGTGLDRLIDAIEGLYEINETKEEDKIWNQSDYDNILSPEVLQGLDTEYQKLEQSIKDNEGTIKDADEDIKAIDKQIQITMGAIQRSEEYLDSLSGSALNAARNLSTVSLSAASFKFSNDDGSFKRNGVTYMPRAVGIDYAPNGFRAELHQGEAILTREDNEQRMRGSMGIDEMEAALENAIERSMSRMYINMSGEKVADITTRRTEHNISGSEHARTRAMGG